MTVATSELLKGLHGRLAEAMSEALDAEIARIAFSSALYELDTSDMTEEAAKHISQAISLAPSARVDNGLLKTVSSFLKDNSITADLDEGAGEDAATTKLRELKEKRKVASTPLEQLH